MRLANVSMTASFFSRNLFLVRTIIHAIVLHALTPISSETTLKELQLPDRNDAFSQLIYSRDVTKENHKNEMTNLS